ncbi:MAG: zinc ribbon domain-containing protein [Gemmatimonadetes bacterium]|nr:zinc ribbon domain-containing protein [Gemmatimonadota bacterium]
MPTYQYRCNKCRHEFSEFQSITADPLSTCPECGGAVKRLISGGAGFLFKGDGFYTTDYRSENYKQAEKADRESSSSKSDGGSDGSKSDAKSSGGGSSDASGSGDKSKSEASPKADSSSGPSGPSGQPGQPG